MPASVATAGWMPTANGESSTAAKARGGAWQALGVSAIISKALTLRGFKIPTPIQRNTLPSTLSTPPRDVLGMARTGSGKTLAYLIPLIQHLTTAHNPKRGTRALILCPARELAMQILKVGKDLGRSAARGPGKDSQGLTWALIMGGEGLDKQFEALSEQPDIIIATPGRLLHVAVEMNLDFRSLEMVIYDEADRLFEMGFELQLHEIVHRLPASRQNLLFSATLPSAVAEFAKAGLVNPLLIRLDADHKISEDLAMAFFDVKSTMKEAALLAILETNLRVLTNRQETEKSPQAIIFVSTKHHVEYLSYLLVTVGYRVNHIYGSLDQIARQQQLAGFRDGTADLLIVTDVAARGLDIPIMDNVINYDFPTGVRNFIHRVGRTARAGRKGAAWSFVTKEELPYLLELETFLEQPITQNQSGMFFTIPQTAIDQKLESISALEETASDLPSLRQVMRKGQTMFERSRSKASAASHRNSKALRQRVNAKETAPPEHPSYGSVADSEVAQLQSRLLASVQNFTPQETILELGKRGSKGSVDLMSARRRLVAQRDTRPKKALASVESDDEEEPMVTDVKTTRSYRDEHYIDHRQQGAEKNSGYSLKDANFVDQMRSSTLDLVQDEGSAVRAGKASQLKWDRKSKKFGNKNEVGADNKKMIRSESGALLPASYRSGRYDEWRKSKRGQPSDGSKDEPGKPKKLQHYRHQQLKTELKSPSAILGSRRNLEKRKAKNSRVPRRRK